jgi:2-polyprenyl-6-methoxyphenol hydroxylase-like FAD-dependent oxidoreductase
VVAHGRTLARIRFAPKDSPYPFIAMVPQDVTEQLLVEQLGPKGGAVEYETSFISATQHDKCVLVTLDRKGQRLGLTAAFVVGCDGAHSTVRHALNLPFEGAAYEAMFLLADVQTNETLPADELQLCPSEFGPVAIFPMSATRRRIVATIQDAEGDAPSLALVRKVLSQRAPREIEARALQWSSYFRIHHRQVAQLRVGRIFIAGDAAHIHSPFGGQGMNTGLQDVWNLAWKLDLALHGNGHERLLDSYSTERRPVIKQVLRTTDLLTKAMGTSNRLAQALRDTPIPWCRGWPRFNVPSCSGFLDSVSCIAEAQSLRGWASGTSMIRCAAALALTAVSCSWSMRARTQRLKRRRNRSPHLSTMSLSCDGCGARW